MDKDIQKVVDALIQENVVAIVLGGSNCIGLSTISSDIDICVYYEGVVDIQQLNESLSQIDDENKRDILLPLYSWGPWLNSGGVCVVDKKNYDITFRELSFVEEILSDCISGNIYSIYNPAYPFGYCTAYLVGEVEACQVLYKSSDKISILKKCVQGNHNHICDVIAHFYIEAAIFQCVCGIKQDEKRDRLYKNAQLQNCTFSFLSSYAARSSVLLFHNKNAAKRLLKSEKAKAVIGECNLRFLFQIINLEINDVNSAYTILGKLIMEEADKIVLQLNTPANYEMLRYLLNL